MTVLYIILAAILVLLLIFALVFASPLFVRVVYKEQLLVYAGISFVKIKVFPKKEKEQKRKKTAVKTTKKQTPHLETNEKKSANASTAHKGGQAQKSKSVKETLSLILDIVKEVFSVMGKRAEIRIEALNVSVSKPDAADTAVQFGLCQGIVSTLLALSSEFSKAHINDKNISVVPDFISGKSSLMADITLKVPLGSLLFSVIKGFFKNQFRK